jgi:hypothetical protein
MATGADAAGPGGMRRRLSRERLFYGGMALLILALVLWGFARSWLLRGVLADSPRSPLPGIVQVHGAIFLGWVLLFMTQAALISTRYLRWHRILGFSSLALAAAMVVVGVEVTVLQYQRGSGPPGIDPLTWLAAPLFDLPAFAGLVIAGVIWRHQPQVHKRLMLLGTCVLLQAALGRFQPFPPDFLAGEGMTLIAWSLSLLLLGWDVASRGRPHVATLIGIGVLGAEQLLRLALWNTEGWHAVARWIVATLG